MNNKNKEKIVFTLPEGILSEVDKIIQMENSNREDFAKAAFQFYITQKKKLNLKEKFTNRKKFITLHIKNTGTVVLIMTPRYQIRRIFTVSQIYSVTQLKR